MRSRLRPRPNVCSGSWRGPRSGIEKPSWWSPDSSSWWPACSGGTSPRGSPRGGFDVTSEQSVHAATVLASEFHDGSDNILVLVHATSGTIDSAAVVSAGTALTRQLAAQPHMANVMSYWSVHSPGVLGLPDHRDALIVGRITGNQDQVTHREPAIAAGLKARDGTITFAVGGFGAAFHEVNSVVERDLLHAEAFAVPLTLLLLLFVFGSLVAAAMPLTIGAVAVVGTLLVLRILNGITPVSIYAVNLATVLGLGLAIDYSLFIVSRFREELLAGHDTPAALEETLANAGRTVAGSALTMAAAAGALFVFPLVFLRSFAYSGIAVVLLAGAAAWSCCPQCSRSSARGSTPSPSGAVRSDRRRTGSGPSRRAASCGGPSPSSLRWRWFWASWPGPSCISAWATSTTACSHPRTMSGRWTTRCAPNSVKGKPTHSRSWWPAPARRPRPSRRRTQTTSRNFPTWRASLPPVASTSTAPAAPHRPRTWPSSATATGSGTRSSRWVTASRPREKRSSMPFATGRLRSPILVGGTPASLVDSTSVINHYLPLAVLLVVGATFLILLFLFRSLFIPLKALVLSVISLSATFGVMVWIFQEGHLSRLFDFTPTGTLIDTMPILMFCVAFGLSMDYEVFLVSRMKELHDSGADNDAAIAGGMQQTGQDHHRGGPADEHHLPELVEQQHLVHQAVRRRAGARRPDGRLHHPRHFGTRHHEAGGRRRTGGPLRSCARSLPPPAAQPRRLAGPESRWDRTAELTGAGSVAPIRPACHLIRERGVSLMKLWSVVRGPKSPLRPVPKAPTRRATTNAPTRNEEGVLDSRYSLFGMRPPKQCAARVLCQKQSA